MHTHTRIYIYIYIWMHVYMYSYMHTTTPPFPPPPPPPHTHTRTHTHTHAHTHTDTDTDTHTHTPHTHTTHTHTHTHTHTPAFMYRRRACRRTLPINEVRDFLAQWPDGQPNRLGCCGSYRSRHPGRPLNCTFRTMTGFGPLQDHPNIIKLYETFEVARVMHSMKLLAGSMLWPLAHLLLTYISMSVSDR